MADIFPSHYLVRTPGLKQAVADYEKAGFNVTWGSAPEKAYNAFIYFEKGGFIELFDPPIPRFLRGVAAAGAFLGVGLMQRYHRWSTTSGFCDFALETASPLDEAVQDKPLPKPRKMSRVQPDGVKVQWQLATPKDPFLPFVMGPYDPPLDVDESKTGHANGLRTITGLKINHPDPGAFAAGLAKLMPQGQLAASGDDRTLTVNEFEMLIAKADKTQFTELFVGEDVPEVFPLHGLVLRRRGNKA